MKSPNLPPWKKGHFSEDHDNDPTSGLINVMDVMLVFALGLLIALISQNQDMQAHFNISEAVDVQQGKELIEVPQAIKDASQGKQNQGLKSMGQVYQDPETGKLILIQ